MISEKERHQWITQILRALADLRACEQESARAVGLDSGGTLVDRQPSPSKTVREKEL